MIWMYRVANFKINYKRVCTTNLQQEKWEKKEQKKKEEKQTKKKNGHCDGDI